MRYIRNLTEEEIASLTYGYQNGKKHYFRVKCKSLLMSHEGKTIAEIVLFSKKTPRTIRNWFNSFEKFGLENLVIRSGRGIKAALDSLTEEQIKFVKAELGQSYQNLKKVCTKLSKEFGFQVTKNMLKRYLKKNSAILGDEFVKA